MNKGDFWLSNIQQKMLSRDESRNDLGTIRIHKNVIASVAALAACEIEGVKGIGRNAVLSLFGLLGRKNAGSIGVEIDKNEEVRINIPLIIKYGFNIPDVANRVQENISSALDKTTSLPVKYININVQGIERG
ncbi:MAG: Asp23/Gls24 family envelope stress response protein [Candidatus Omnitrophota bacterium]